MSDEIVNAYIFEGNEGIDDTCIFEVTWTTSGIHAQLCKMYTDYECDVDVGDMFVGCDPYPISDTIHKVGEGLYQAVADAHDGGMIYIVRIYD